MKKSTALIFLVCFSFNTFSQTVTDLVHYVMIIDKTKSMIGEGDGKGANIWPDVLNATNKFIENLPDKGTVSVYTFADNISERKPFDLENTSAKNDIKGYLNKISVDGNYTAVYDAMDKVFREVVKKDSDSPLLIYIFTDGKDNRSSMDFQKIMDYYNANRTDYAHSYYIKLRGNLDNELKEKISKTDGIEALEISNLDSRFTYPVTLTPRFKKLVYNLALKSTQVQVFDIRGEKPSTGFVFDATLLGLEAGIGNLSLSKTSNYSLSGENNECEFVIKAYGDLKTEKGKNYKAKIKISNPKDGIHKISFLPDEFEIEFTNAAPPKVTIVQPWKRK